MISGIVSARHGTYDSKLNLSDEGKEQMLRLANAIKGVVNGHGLNIFLRCSTAPRAQQGAPIIAGVLQIPESQITLHEELWDDDFHCGNYQEAQNIVDTSLQDGTLSIFLSHLDIAPAIARHAITKLGTGHGARALGYGQGMLITRDDLVIIP